MIKPYNIFVRVWVNQYVLNWIFYKKNSSKMKKYMHINIYICVCVFVHIYILINLKTICMFKYWEIEEIREDDFSVNYEAQTE